MSDFSFSTPAPSATQSLNGLGRRFRTPPSQARWAMWLRGFGPHVAALCAEAMRCRAFRTTNARPQARSYAQTLHAASRRRSNFRLQTKCARVHGVACGRIMQTLARLRFLLLAFRLASRLSSCFSVFAFRYCSKSTSLLSRKNSSATRATAAMPPMYQPSAWMPNVMTRADAMVGANAPPVMAARL